MSANLSEGLVLGMGNPLLDMSASVEEQFLQQYDLKPNDAILAAEKHKPLYEELVRGHKVDYTAGGSVQNALRVAQWVLRKPKVTVFFGSVGADEYSRILEDRARGQGVDVHYQCHAHEPTGKCAVLITDNGHSRSLCADLGAANCFTIDHIRTPENKKLIHNAKYYYVSGFFLTVSPPSIIEVAEHAHTNNHLFMMNLSAPFISQFYKEPLMRAMPYVDILFGNEMEAEAFAKEQNFNTDDFKEIALKITQLPKHNTNRSRIAVLTHGHHPVVMAKDGVVTEFPVPQLAPEKVVDTNGAGDAFVGGAPTTS
ncbi:adenosine kinase isoform X2 [Bacillus rossius redtenbacheri]|uniref:adenosine kinase isoform X2 n=1 Tax=Bacillus rossius redtenbacheri TaxID=93214 RepID=UPI002FDD2DBE